MLASEIADTAIPRWSYLEGGQHFTITAAGVPPIALPFLTLLLKLSRDVDFINMDVQVADSRHLELHAIEC